MNGAVVANGAIRLNDGLVCANVALGERSQWLVFPVIDLPFDLLVASNAEFIQG